MTAARWIWLRTRFDMALRLLGVALGIVLVQVVLEIGGDGVDGELQHGKRLVDLVRDAGGHLAEGRQACGVEPLHLGRRRSVSSTPRNRMYSMRGLVVHVAGA